MNVTNSNRELSANGSLSQSYVMNNEEEYEYVEDGEDGEYEQEEGEGDEYGEENLIDNNEQSWDEDELKKSYRLSNYSDEQDNMHEESHNSKNKNGKFENEITPEEMSQHSNAEMTDINKNMNEIEQEIYENSLNLSPDRKIRYKLLRFINKLRENYSLNELQQDPVGIKVANEYAKYLLKEKENEKYLSDLTKQFNYKGNFNISTFTAFVDVTSDTGSKKTKYSDYVHEFVDAHATLVEFSADRENMLSTEFNTVSIGLAYDEEKVVVVDIFSIKEIWLESCSINRDAGIITVKGRMLNDFYGVYAMRVLSCENMNKNLLLINPSNIISPEKKNRPFIGTFSNAKNILSDKSIKIVDILIRERPGNINYGKPFAEPQNKFEKDLEFLKLGLRFYLDDIPNEYELREHQKEEENELKRIELDEMRKNEVKKRETDEKEYRNKNYEGGETGGKYSSNIIKEDPNEEDDNENSSREDHKHDKTNIRFETNNNKTNKSGVSASDSSYLDSIQSDAVGNKENYDKQLNRLEQNIDELKKENEDLQKKIRIIYDFRRKEGRDDRNYYKESNINESTYADSLTSAANLHNELNTHKKKLMADLDKYNQSIEIQEERKREVYKILMNYKEELLQNAEYRKGTKIPRQQINLWLEKERESEEEIRKLRIDNIKNTLELNRLNKELKKMEEYFEGLHLIDFEQLKIENNTLTEKIEDRNEEIHKLNNKINTNVQILAHLQEKFAFIDKESDSKKMDEKNLVDKLINKKDTLNDVKKNNEKNTLKKLQCRQKIDQVNSSNLKEYYTRTNFNIKDLQMKIELALNELKKYRKSKDTKDINLLESRKELLIEEYSRLPKIENVDQR